jgi:hypothetical protein
MLVVAFVIAQGIATIAAGRMQTVDEPLDFIRFDGAVYLSTVYLAEDSAETPYIPISAADVGPAVGRVVTSWVDANDELAAPNEPCYWAAPNGTAPRLTAGDRIYAVRGYSTRFRLVARHAQGFVSYQVWCSDWARVGADLFDIYARVDRISVTEDLSESSGWAVIADRATVDRLVGMVLEGKVLPEELVSTEPVTHQLIIHLDDGTTFRTSVAREELLWGLGAVAVPSAFTETLHQAWAQRATGVADAG